MEEFKKRLKQTKAKEDLQRVLLYIKENPITEELKANKELIDFILDIKIDIDTQTAILLHYIDLFFSLSIKSEQLSHIPIEQIFKANNSFYNEICLEHFIAAYYAINYPKANGEQFKKGDKVDFLQIDDGKYYAWTQAEVFESNDTVKQYLIRLPINSQLQSIQFDSYRIQPLNSFTADDFNWRVELKEGDIIDALDTGNRWNKSTVLSRKDNSIVVALRTYETEARIMYVGFGELYDFTCSVFDSRIRKKETFTPVIYFPSLYAALPKENSKFNPHSMHIPFEGKHFIIPKPYDNRAMYSLEYIALGNSFVTKQLELMKKAKDALIVPLERIDYLIAICNALFNLHEHLHPHFAKEFVPAFIAKAQEYLIAFSKAEMRNFTKASIVSVIQNLRGIMDMAYYPWEISSHVAVFEISFGMNCLSSSIMEKQLLGLKILSDSLMEGTKQYSSNEKLKAISSLLARDERNRNVFDVLFSGNFHSEIIKKSSEVTVALFKLRVINKEEIDQLYQLIHSTSLKEVKEAIYEVLSKGSAEMSSELLFHTINKLYEINKEDITKEDIHLLVELTKRIPQSFWYDTAVQLLNFLYDAITKDQHEHLIKPFCDLISYSDHDDIVFKVYLLFFDKIVDSLTAEGLYMQMKLLANLLTTIPNRIEKDLIPKAAQVLFDSHKKWHELLIAFCRENNTKADVLNCIIKVIEATKNISLLSDTFLQSLFELYTQGEGNKENAIFFFNWLKELQSKNLFSMQSIELLFALLKKNTQLQTDPTLTKELLGFFWNLFVSVNQLNSKDFKSNTANPLKLKHADVIWPLLLASEKEDALISSFIEMYALPWVPQAERSIIWEETINKTFNEMTAANKKNSLKILTYLIEASDSFGTANSKPHAALMESSELKIEISNEIDINNIYSFELIVSSALTLFDLRAMISERIKLPIMSFGIHRFLDLIVRPRVNGRTLGSLFYANTKLKLKRSDEVTLEKKPLTLDNNAAFSVEGRRVFETMFKVYSTNGKMSREQNCKLVFNAIGGVDRITVEDPNVKKMFEKDDDNDGFLTEANVVDFYFDAVKSNKAEVVWMNINNFNYRNDLRHISEPFERDIHMNEDRILMPRYILSHNNGFFKKLFELQGDGDCDVSDAANGLISMLETNEVIYNDIISNSNSSGNYLTEAKDNAFQLIYVFEIISSVINASDKGEDLSPLLKAFITSPSNENEAKSSFEKVIDIFIEQMAVLIDENKPLMKLYSLELKLIKICLVSLVNNKELKQLLSHFDKEVNEAMPQVNCEEVSSALLKPNLQLKRLAKVIIDNMPVLNNKEKLYELKKTALIYSFQILTMALLSDGAVDFNKAFELKLNDFLLNQLKTPFEFAQRLGFVVIKALFTQFNTQTSSQFIAQTEELIIKEVFLNNSALNQYNPVYVFKIYQEIISVQQYEQERKILIIKDIIKELTSFLNVYTEDMLTGYFSILNALVTSIESTPDVLQEVVIVLVNKFLISDDTFNYPFTSNAFVKEVFSLLSLLISKSTSSLQLLFFSTKFSELQVHLTQLAEDKRQYDPSVESKLKLGYIGIKNLGAICYMISILQQFFFIQPFRYCINEASLPLEADTPLFQLKKMFAFMTLSNRRDYSPHDFAHSFKDSEGQPIDIKDQYDAQEFLSRFLDKMETVLSSTQFKYLLQGVIGGESCSQLFCRDPDCDKVSNRFEAMSYLSLEIKHMSTLSDCLKKYISEEQIDDFYCEKCKKKTSHSKRVSLNKLPNVLIIHLQRIAFDYETYEMAKIDSKLEYPKDLNMKDYCTERMQSNGTGVEESNDDFNAHVYDREDEYYQYHLKGVVIHTGTAQYGHYFSIVNVSTSKDKEVWLKFNDSIVSEYQISKLDQDTYGGSQKSTEWMLDANQNAYLLFYEREKKTKVASVLSPQQDESSGIQVKEPKYLKSETEMNKELDVFIKGKEEMDQVYCLHGEAIEVVDYNALIEKEINRDKAKMVFYEEVMKDNIKFNNDKRVFTKSFNEFIEAAAKQMRKNQELSDDETISLFMKIHSTVKVIIAKSYHTDNLPKIIKKLIKAVKAYPILSSMLLNEILDSQDKWLSSFILIQDNTIGPAFALYISSIIQTSIGSSTDTALAYALINHYLEWIPVQLSRKWNQMSHFLEVFDHLAQSEEEKLIDYLKENGVLMKLIDFFLGKESPFYTKDDRTEIGNKTTKGKFAPLLSAVANLLNANVTMMFNAKEIKCLNSKQFYSKALSGEYDLSSLGRIMAHFMLNNEEFTKERLNELIPFISSASGVSTYKGIVSMIEHVLSVSDDFTQLRLENLIGKPQFRFNSIERKVSINYIAPLMSEKETVISKIIATTSSSKDFIGIAKTLYEIALKNDRLFDYMKDLPHMECCSHMNGLIQLIREKCLNVIETFDLRKDDKLKEQIAGIEKLEEEISAKLGQENQMSMELLIARSMKVKSENAMKVDYACGNEEMKNSLLLMKGHYEIIELTEEAFKESNKAEEGIDIGSAPYYLSDLMQLLEGKALTREIVCSPNDISYKLIRYFLVNTSNAFDHSISLKFSAKDKPDLPNSSMSILIPKQSLIEIIVIKKEEDLVNAESISIHSTIDHTTTQAQSQPILALPSPNDIYDCCTITCPMCGELNLLDSSNPELKCKACQIFLFS